MKASAQLHAESRKKTNTEIRDWMTDYLVAHLSLDRGSVDVSKPFDEYGIDSAVAMRMIGDLEDYMGRELSPSLPYQYPTIESLSEVLA